MGPTLCPWCWFVGVWLVVVVVVMLGFVWLTRFSMATDDDDDVDGSGSYRDNKIPLGLAVNWGWSVRCAKPWLGGLAPPLSTLWMNSQLFGVRAHRCKHQLHMVFRMPAFGLHY